MFEGNLRKLEQKSYFLHVYSFISALIPALTIYTVLNLTDKITPQDNCIEFKLLKMKKRPLRKVKHF